MGKINMGFFYGKKYNPRNRTFSLENGENFIEGTGLGPLIFWTQSILQTALPYCIAIDKLWNRKEVDNFHL